MLPKSLATLPYVEELDTITSAVVDDYLMHHRQDADADDCQSNREVVHWELMDMRLQVLDSGGPHIIQRPITPRGRRPGQGGDSDMEPDEQ